MLDVGPFCGASAVFLAQRGIRVTVAELNLDRLGRAPQPDDDGNEVLDPQVARIDADDEAFDLILAWDACDFVAPKWFPIVADELKRVLAPRGWLMLFARGGRAANTPRDRPARVRIVAEDRIETLADSGAALPRWEHSNRQIETAFAPLAVGHIHLQRNQVREILLQKPAD